MWLSRLGGGGWLRWLSTCCHVTDSVVCLFLVVPLVGLQCVIVAFPGRSRLLFGSF